MVWHTSYAKSLTIEIICYAINVGVEFSIVFDRDCRFATECSEDNVVKRLCVTHGLNIWFSLVFVACLRHACFSRGCCIPHTALHFVALMWGYWDGVPPARKVHIACLSRVVGIYFFCFLRCHNISIFRRGKDIKFLIRINKNFYFIWNKQKSALIIKKCIFAR